MGESQEKSVVGQGLFYLVVLLGLQLLWHGSLLWGGDVLSGRDLTDQFIPMRESQKIHGFMAAWHQETFAGRPFHEDIQSGFLYPPYQLFSLASTELVYTFLTFGHLLLGGLGMAFFLQRRLAPIASLFGAIVWTFGSYQLLRVTSGVVIFNHALAWVPWMLLAVDRQSLKRDGGLLWAGLLALFGGMQLLVGAPQVVQITWAGLFFWTIGRKVFEREEEASWPALLGGYFLAAVSAILIASPILLGAASFLSEAYPRGGADQWAFISDGSVAPWLLLTWIFPQIFGPGNSEEFYWGSSVGYTETNVYTGVIALLLALGSVVWLWRREHLRDESRSILIPTVVIGALGLLVAMGSYGGLFQVLYTVVPTFSSFRVPARWSLWFAIAIAILAAWSLDQLLKTEEENDQEDILKPWLYILLPALVLLALVRAFAHPLLEALGIETILARVPPNQLEMIDSIYQTSTSSIQWAVVMTVVFLGLTSLFLLGKLNRKLFVSLLFLATILDLRSYWTTFNEAIPADTPRELIATEAPFHRIDRDAFRDYYYPETPLITWAKEVDGRLHYDDTLISYMFDEFQRELLSERPAVHGLEITRGYQLIHLTSYVDDYYASFTPPQNNDPGAFFPQIEIKDRRFLDAYNVAYFLNYPMQGLGERLQDLGLEAEGQFTQQGLTAWRNPGARGWAWLSEQEDFLDAEANRELGTIKILERSSDQQSYTVETTAPAIIHLSAPESDGWVLTVEPTAEILSSRSARLTVPGVYTVTRSYHSRVLTTANLMLMAAGVMMMLGMIVFGWKKR